jgi:ComF family protein
MDSAGGGGEQGAGVDRLDAPGMRAEPSRPGGIGGADEQGALETTMNVADPLETFGKGALVEEQFRTRCGGAVARHGAAAAVEQIGRSGLRLVRIGHWAACAAARGTRQGAMATGRTVLKRLATSVLDFALPPRCAGCGEVIDEVDGFCRDCWLALDWLGNNGCAQCGLPLEATEAASCAKCLAIPPPLERMRAAVAYGPMSRVIVLKLKYGRKVALARTMARFMAPLRGDDSDDARPIVVPVPLHRRRLWWRGFNQAGLVARHLGKAWRIEVDPHLLRRTRSTPPLKGMNEKERRRAVKGAFALAEGRRIDGRSVILIDDVMTSGSTAAACAAALRAAGAGRVELISWARVVRPIQLMR